jgi:hypothetical protein
MIFVAFYAVLLVPLAGFALAFRLALRSRRPPHRGDPRTLPVVVATAAYGWWLSIGADDPLLRAAVTLGCGLLALAGAYTGWARRDRRDDRPRAERV